MSLICWWPLNGDTKNYGTLGGEVEVTASNPIYINGKIGQALYTGTLNLTADQWKKIIGNTISIAMWIYTRDDGLYSAGTPFFGMSGMTAPNNRKFSMFHYNTKTNLHCSWQNDNSNETYWGCHYSNFFELNKWVHLCVVQDAVKETITVYRNGVQYSKSTVTGLASMNFKSAGAAPIRASINYQHMNDIRIYNHALSAAEVKELSKALVVHYTFDDELIEPTTNIMPINYQKGQFITGASNNNYDSAGSFTVNTTVHGTYTLSGYYKIETTDTATYPRISLNVKYAEDSNSISLKQEWTIHRDGEWHYFSLTGTTNSTKTLQNLSGWLFDYSNPGNGRICYAKDIQLELKEHATPYTPSNRESMLYNEAGLTQPNRNTIQNIQLIMNAAINKYSLKCNDTKILTPMVSDISQGATLSLWINLPKDNSGKNIFPSSSEVVAADNNSQLAFGFYDSMHGIITCAGFKKSIMTNLKTALVNGWNHIAVIRDSSNNIKGYLNGVEYPLTGSQEWTHSEPYFSIGCRYSGSWTSYYNGQVDDIRLYNTCLSPEEIKELYDCGGRISNLGDALTGSFIEGETATKVNKNHTITTKELYEQILPDGYQQLEWIETDGYAYINTGYNSSAPYQIDCDMEITGSTLGNYWFGQQQNSNRMLYNGFYSSMSLEFNWLTVSAAGTRKIMTQTLINSTQINITINGISTIRDIGTNGQGGDLYIFACRYPDNTLRTYRSKMKLYSFKIHEGSNYIRDFIPARNSDGVLGLYDIINNQFYTNAGSGNFIAGPTITTGQASILREGGLTAREIIEI